MEKIAKCLGFNDHVSFIKYFNELDDTRYREKFYSGKNFMSDQDKYRKVRNDQVIQILYKYSHLDNNKNQTFKEIIESMPPNDLERIDLEEKLDIWSSGTKYGFITIYSKPAELLTSGLFKKLKSQKESNLIDTFPLYSISVKPKAKENHDYSIFDLGENMKILRREMYYVKDLNILNDALFAIQYINHFLDIKQPRNFSRAAFSNYVCKNTYFFKTDIKHAFASFSVKKYTEVVKNASRNPLIRFCLQMIQKYYNLIAEVYPHTEDFLPITPVSRFLFHSFLGYFTRYSLSDIVYAADDIIVGGTNPNLVKASFERLCTKLKKHGFTFNKSNYYSKKNTTNFTLEYMGVEYRAVPNSYVITNNSTYNPVDDKEKIDNNIKKNDLQFNSSLDIFI